MSDTRESLNQRGWDLLRQMRMELHGEELITDEEYALLAVDHPAVKRLENYDVLRQQVESLRAEKAAIGSSIYEIHSMMVPDPLQADNARTFSEALHELGVAAVGVVALRAKLAAEKQRADALEADKERLDWIEGRGCTEIEVDIANLWSVGDQIYNDEVYDSLREAIDAARKPVPQETVGPLCPDSPDGNHHVAPIGSDEEWLPSKAPCYYCGDKQAPPVPQETKA